MKPGNFIMTLNDLYYLLSLPLILLFILKMINETTTEIAPNLYIGNINVISHAGIAQLEKLGVQQIVLVAKIQISSELKTHLKPFKVAVIEAVDSEEQDLLSHFDKTYELISHAIKQQYGVVIACEAGISRSVTIVAGYLMKENDWDAYDALEAIKKRRKLAHPNEGFFEQLQLYEKMDFSTKEMDLEMKQKLMKYPIKAQYIDTMTA